MIPGARTFAPWPVWRDSVAGPVRYAPLPKRQTRQPGRQDGAIGRNGLAVLHALLFDFLNYASGRLDPSYGRIAEKAAISVRSVARGLVQLRAAGVLNWLRRCREDHDASGRFQLRQESNAYAVLPARQWRGYLAPPDPPPPDPATWAAPPLPDVIEQAFGMSNAGAGPAAVLQRLKDDPSDKVAMALAGLFGEVFRQEPPQGA